MTKRKLLKEPTTLTLEPVNEIPEEPKPNEELRAERLKQIQFKATLDQKRGKSGVWTLSASIGPFADLRRFNHRPEVEKEIDKAKAEIAQKLILRIERKEKEDAGFSL